MIEEVVNSILDAEDVAEKRIDAAKHTASDIVSAAEAQADSIKKQSAAENKQALADGIKRIEQQSTETFDATLKQLKEETDAEMAKYEKNVSKVVKIILEHLK